VVAGDGFEPSKAKPTVLQTAQSSHHNHALACADNVLPQHWRRYVPHWFHKLLESILTGNPSAVMPGFPEPTQKPLPEPTKASFQAGTRTGR
jgi:hypothetical protein